MLTKGRGSERPKQNAGEVSLLSRVSELDHFVSKSGSTNPTGVPYARRNSVSTPIFSPSGSTSISPPSPAKWRSLRANTGIFEQIFKRCDEALCIMQQNGEVVHMNPAWLTLFGYEPKQSSTCTPRDCLGKEIFEILLNRLRRYSEFHEDMLVRTRKGVLKGISIRSFEIPAEQQQLFVAGPSKRGEGPVLYVMLGREQESHLCAELFLDIILEESAGMVGRAFCEKLVGMLARVLQVPIAFLREVSATNSSLARLVALTVDGELQYQPNAPYTRSSTPADHSTDKSVLHFPDGVQALFPRDKWLRSHHVESYLAIPLINQDGNLVGHMGVMSTEPLQADVMKVHVLKMFAGRAASELDHMRREEAHRMELENASDEYVEFLSMVSHQVRTPLNAISNFTQFVLESDLTSEQRHHLEIVKSSAQQMLSVIQDVFDLNKLALGYVSLEFSPFDLLEELSACEMRFMPMAASKDIDLVLKMLLPEKDTLLPDRSAVRRSTAEPRDEPKYLIKQGVRMFSEAGAVASPRMHTSPPSNLGGPPQLSLPGAVSSLPNETMTAFPARVGGKELNPPQASGGGSMSLIPATPSHPRRRSWTLGDVRMSHEIVDNGKVMLLGDAKRFQQIIDNLISNAIEATPSKGRVKVSCEVRLVMWQHVEVVCSVSDTGPGLCEEDLQHLLHRHMGRTMAGPNHFSMAGLGLSIAYHLAKLMGGSIEYRPVGPDGNMPGSTFMLTLRSRLVCRRSMKNISVRNLAMTGVDRVLNDHWARQAEEGRRRNSVSSCSRSSSAASLAGGSNNHLHGGASAEMLPVTRISVVSRNQSRTSMVSKYGPPGSPIIEGMLSDSRDFDDGNDGSSGHGGGVNGPKVGLQLSRGAEHSLGNICAASFMAAPVNPTTTKQGIPPPLTNRSMSVSSSCSSREQEMRILVVEDNRVNQQVAQMLLRKMGLTCTVASDGVEGVEAVDREAFHFILMDLQMPRMGGMEATAKIRAMEAVQETVGVKHRAWIVALTADVVTFQRCDFLNAGMDDFLAKPLKLAELAESIARYQLVAQAAEAQAAAITGSRNISETTDNSMASPRFVDDDEQFLMYSDDIPDLKMPPVAPWIQDLVGSP